MKQEMPRVRLPPIPDDATIEQRYALYQKYVRDLMAQGDPAHKGERNLFAWIADLFRPRRGRD